MESDGAQRLWQCFSPLEIHSPDCPAWFATAVPTDRLLVDFPNFPAAALPQRGRAANGRGLSREACLRSCLGELIELASCCSWGDENIITASSRDLGEGAISAEKLLGLSETQYEERNSWNTQYGWFDWRPKCPDPGEKYEWLQAYDAYSEQVVYVPADVVLIGRREAGDEQAIAISDSNGCASGMSLKQAKLAALLELVERDAVARWWYGGRPCTPVHMSAFCSSEPLLKYLQSRKRHCLLVDITTDIPLWAFAAVTCEPDGSDVAIGSAASPNPICAAESALVEALQMEISLEVARRSAGISLAWSSWRKMVSMKSAPLNALRNPQKHARDRRELTGFQGCLDACYGCGVRILWIDLTRPELGTASARMMSPDLCLLKPRFKRKRLVAPRSCSEMERQLADTIPLLV